jgi:hypothetical protein
MELNTVIGVSIDVKKGGKTPLMILDRILKYMIKIMKFY